MLNENIKAIRKSKGLSQEELSIKLHVVRQTVSKWESGLSVPDAEMLMTISEILETPVSEILGESIEEKDEQEQIEIIHNAYQKLREKDNEIRNNLKLMDIKLADIVMPIKAGK